MTVYVVCDCYTGEVSSVWSTKEKAEAACNGPNDRVVEYEVDPRGSE